MTNPTPPEQVPEELLLADQYAAAHAKWALEDLYGSSKSYTAEKLAERHAARANLERALHAAHVQNPAEIEHVAGDVSKNGVELNTSTQQPAPSAGVTVEQVEDAIGLQSSAWDTIGAEKIVEAVLRLTNGQAPATQQAGAPSDSQVWSAMEAFSKHDSNSEGMRAALLAGAFAPQPSPTAQAASSAVLKAIRKANMQLVRTGDNAFMLVPYKAATAQAAESVPAIQGEMNVQLDIDSNHSAPGRQRDVARSVALGQPMGHGPNQVAGHLGAQGDKLLTVAERNIRRFLRSAQLKGESDREAALNCVDVLWAAARAPAESVGRDAERLDFLIEQRAYVVSDPDACPGYWLHFVHKETGQGWVQGDEHPTPRAAIDAAMAANGGNK